MQTVSYQQASKDSVEFIIVFSSFLSKTIDLIFKPNKAQFQVLSVIFEKVF